LLGFSYIVGGGGDGVKHRIWEIISGLGFRMVSDVVEFKGRV